VLLPDAGDRLRCEAVAAGNRVGSGVEDDTLDEAFPEPIAQERQPSRGVGSQAAGSQAAGCLDLDRGDTSVGVLEDDVDLGSGAVPVVVAPDRVRRSR
jgi:hypothetical protein